MTLRPILVNDYFAFRCFDMCMFLLPRNMRIINSHCCSSTKIYGLSRKPERIEVAERILVSVSICVQPTFESNRIGFQVPAGGRVICTVVVVD